MTMNPRGTFFERLFGPDVERHFGALHSSLWGQKAAWEMQKASWKAERQARKAAWKAQRSAQRAMWRAQRRSFGPFSAIWGMLWTLAWLGFFLLLVISPEFRSSTVNFLQELPRFVIHVLHQVAGRAEI